MITFSGLMLPLSVPLHKSKTLKKDPFPKPSYYSAEVSMDLFSFIHHADPTKVRVGEIEKVGDQVLLLEATRGHGAEKEHSSSGGKYVALTKAIVKPVYENVVEKPRRLKKKGSQRC
ncbi:hypothetical protein Tco_0159723 [Tanacetum coccineum]